jgi:hypothetical protein
MRNLTALLLLAAAPALAGDGKWIDGKLENWNKKGSPIPAAPKLDAQPILTGPCSEQLRRPHGPEDKAVADAGWGLTGALQIHSGVAVVAGAAAADGMCRPLGFQVFVFIDGKFAGTLSPEPMNSRSDGMLSSVQLLGKQILAAYQRYGPNDALCCPSRTSDVLFKAEGNPVAPVEARSRPNP